MTIQILLTRTILRKSLVSLQLRKRHNYIFAFHVTLMCAVSQVTMISAIVEYEASEKYKNFQFFFTSNKNPLRLILVDQLDSSKEES